MVVLKWLKGPNLTLFQEIKVKENKKNQLSDVNFLKDFPW